MLKSSESRSAGVNYITERELRVNDYYADIAAAHIRRGRCNREPFKFTHTADCAARVVVRNILMPFQFLRQKIDCTVVPWCTYTDPEVAHVGLGEKEAKQKNDRLRSVSSFRWKMSIARWSKAKRPGFAKILTAKGSDKILGATIVAPHAGDLLHEFVLAMKAGIGLGTIASTIHAYPTFAELARKAGDKYNKTRLTPRAKKIFTWLYERARK